jgi:uncharacterized lipoprotein YmbA
MPETKIYSLYMPLEKIEINKKLDMSIVILVDSPRYLRQPYIVYRNSPYQTAVSKYSRWDLPPTEIIKGSLKDSLFSTGLFKEVKLSNLIPDGFYLLRIKLWKFERFDEGTDSFGELVFDVNILSSEGKGIYNNTISKRVKLDDRSFLSLAKGLSGALTEGTREIRTDIIKLFDK